MSAGPTVAGLILAAGESRRMGFPKALLTYRDQTFLDTLCRLFAARCSPVIVVLGAHAERIRINSTTAATYVVNSRYLTGQTSSMQCGLRAVPPTATGVLFTLVDHPAVSPATLDALCGTAILASSSGAGTLAGPCGAGASACPLLVSNQLHPKGAAALDSPPLLRVPRFEGRRGHPIWLSAQLIPEFLAFPETGAARDIVRSHVSQTEFLDVDDPGILADIDDPEAYRQLTGATV